MVYFFFSDQDMFMWDFIFLSALQIPWPIEWLSCGWTKGFKPRSNLRELHNFWCSHQITLSGRSNKSKRKRNWVVNNLFLCWIYFKFNWVADHYEMVLFCVFLVLQLLTRWFSNLLWVFDFWCSTHLMYILYFSR